MASDYGLAFGFRRSDESYRASEGRYRTPAGTELVLGTCVEIDHANPGYLKQAADGAEPRTGICGLLLQEEIWDRSIFEKQRVDSFDLSYALPNRLSVITNGAGVKIWMRNLTSQTRIDGRVIPAITMFDPTGLNLADGDNTLGWDGTKWALDTTAPHMEVVEYNADKAYLEAVLLA